MVRVDDVDADFQPPRVSVSIPKSHSLFSGENIRSLLDCESAPVTPIIPNRKESEVSHDPQAGCFSPSVAFIWGCLCTEML